MEMTIPVPKFAMDFYLDENHVDYVGDIVITSDQRFLVEGPRMRLRRSTWIK